MESNWRASPNGGNRSGIALLSLGELKVLLLLRKVSVIRLTGKKEGVSYVAVQVDFLDMMIGKSQHLVLQTRHISGTMHNVDPCKDLLS